MTIELNLRIPPVDDLLIGNPPIEIIQGRRP
jgi:hypothetical protein